MLKVGSESKTKSGSRNRIVCFCESIVSPLYRESVRNIAIARRDGVPVTIAEAATVDLGKMRWRWKLRAV